MRLLCRVSSCSSCTSNSNRSHRRLPGCPCSRWAPQPSGPKDSHGRGLLFRMGWGGGKSWVSHGHAGGQLFSTPICRQWEDINAFDVVPGGLGDDVLWDKSPDSSLQRFGCNSFRSAGQSSYASCFTKSQRSHSSYDSPSYLAMSCCLAPALKDALCAPAYVMTLFNRPSCMPGAG